MKRKAVSLLLAGVMILGTSVTAMASTVNDNPAKDSKAMEGQGYIAEDGQGTGEGPGEMIDVSVPANGFFWYANEDTHNGTNYDIRSAKYEITNNSEQLNLQVSLLKYEDVTPGTRPNVINPNDVTLELEGDLADADATDLLSSTNGIPSSGITYEDPLEAEETWEYSFTGTYNQTSLPSAAQLSDYVITLELEVINAQKQ